MLHGVSLRNVFWEMRYGNQKAHRYGKNTFMKLGKILRNGKISMHTKKRVLNCYVEPVLLYGSECWTISAQMKRKLRATELWFL